MDAATLRQRLCGSGHEGLRERVGGGDGDRPSHSDVLYRARYACYVVLGFEPEQAFRLALADEIAIVDALRLVENDCPHETALAILL